MKGNSESGLKPFMNESLGSLNIRTDVINDTTLFISVIQSS